MNLIKKISIISCFPFLLLANEINENFEEKNIKETKYEKKNPFQSLISYRENLQKNDEWLRKEETEKKPIIQRYELDKYVIKGFMFTEEDKVILVEEKYSMKKFYLKLFDFIGNNNEQIIEITNGGVMLGVFDEETMSFRKTNIININKK